jgi:hypothetical protein
MASATWGTKGPHPPKFSSLGAFCPRYFFFFPRAGGHWAVGGDCFSVFSGTTGLGKGDVGVRNLAKLCRNVTARCRKCETFLKLILFWFRRTSAKRENRGSGGVAPSGVQGQSPWAQVCRKCVCCYCAVACVCMAVVVFV